MSDYGVKECPQCCSSVVSSATRLIRDTCGHLKCRLCLLKEEKGCVTCELKEKSMTQETEPEELCGEENETKLDLHAESVNKPDCASIKTNNLCEPKNNSIKTLQDPNLHNTLTLPTLRAASTAKTVKKKNFKIGNHLSLLPGTPLKYLCTICNKLCTSKMTIRYHNYCASQVKPFTCETCGKGFVTKTHFEYHCRTHTGVLPFVCSICGKGFKQQGKLKRHSRMHSGERPFVCQECGKSFTSNEGLKNHQQAHNEKPHVCSICSKTFKDYSNFKKHTYRHKGEKTFMCEECGKTFAFKRSLKVHTLIHTERNFMCNMCNRKFTMKRDLKRHEIVHSAVRPHTCALCNIDFRRKDNLERHMKNTHPETRLVPLNSVKQKLKSEGCKLVTNTNNKLTVDGKSAKNDNIENCNDVDPIPPSQMIDPEILHSVPVLSKQKFSIPDQGKDVQESNTSAEFSEKLDPTNIEGKDVHSVCLPADVSHNIQETSHIQMHKPSYERVNHSERASENQNSNHQELTPPSSITVYPPKKNVEYYRAVPVINRSSNSSNIIYNESSSVKRNDLDNVRRGEGTNCVPTITRASEYISNSVITRNHKQNIATVVKPPLSHDRVERLEKLSYSQENQTDQPSLRKLLHDVKCCDGDNILNLTSHVNASSGSFLHDNFRSLDEVEFDKVSCKVIESSVPKAPQSYITDPVAECGSNEYDSCSVPHHVSMDFNKKITADGLFNADHLKLNSISSFHYLSQPADGEYQDNLHNITHLYPKVPSCESTAQFQEDSQKSTTGNTNLCHVKQVDFDVEVSHVNKLDSVPVQSIELPVIVGTKKVTNNVICSNFNH